MFMPEVDKENMGGTMRIDYSNKLDKKWARHEIDRTIHKVCFIRFERTKIGNHMLLLIYIK